MNKALSTFLFASLTVGTFAQQVILDNAFIKREFSLLEQNGLSTVSYNLKDCNDNFVQNTNKEFSFRINDKEYTRFSPWEVSYRDTTEQSGGKGLVFKLKSKETNGLAVRIVYLTFPGIPVVKKQMTFYNTGQKNMKLEAMDTESLKIEWRETETWVMRYYGRYKHVGAYVGDWGDPVITVHDLPGFGEPAEGAWDGFACINTDTKSRGLVGVFRQRGSETERIITVRYLDDKKMYAVKEGKTSKELYVLSGKELITKGFKVRLNKKYDGQLFEIVIK